MPEIFRLFFSITGEEPWLARRRHLNRRQRTEPGVATILNTIYSRELAISSLILNKYHSFGYPSAYERPELLGPYSFAATFVRIYQKLPGPICKILVSRLLGDLKNKGLGSLALELETAAHLSRLGFDLQFHDLIRNSPGSFDFLATRDGLEVEIDCKAISADTGNPISAFGAAAIVSFADDAIKKFRAVGRTIILEVIVSKKVSKRDNVARSIAQAITNSLQEKSNFESEFSTVNYSSRDSKDVQSLQRQSTVQYPLLDGAFGEWDHIIVNPDEGQGGVILLLRSTEKSNRVERITETLKESVEKQFSGLRPVVLFVRLADISGDIFIKFLGRRTFMNDVCDNLFSSTEKRPHIAGVIFLPGTPVVARSTSDDFRVAGEQSVSFFIRNENHPISTDPIFSLLHPPADPNPGPLTAM